MIVPVLVIVKRKITVHIKGATKGYMAAIVSKLKQLCICLLLPVSCYIVLLESIKAKLPPWFYYQTLLEGRVVLSESQECQNRDENRANDESKLNPLYLTVFFQRGSCFINVKHMERFLSLFFFNVWGKFFLEGKKGTNTHRERFSWLKKAVFRRLFHTSTKS